MILGMLTTALHRGGGVLGVGDVIWNTSKVSKTREVTVMAKAHTDVDILRMKVAAFDDTRYAYYCPT